MCQQTSRPSVGHQAFDLCVEVVGRNPEVLIVSIVIEIIAINAIIVIIAIIAIAIIAISAIIVDIAIITIVITVPRAHQVLFLTHVKPTDSSVFNFTGVESELRLVDWISPGTPVASPIETYMVRLRLWLTGKGGV